jgi:tetratricopeptide (TPR) repeat protein
MLKPVLSENAVLQALGCVQNSSPLPDSNPLTQFFLVRQRLPEYLGGKHAELKAIRDILEEAFLTVLGEGRHTAADSLHHIQKAFQCPHSLLQAYCLLYYWYMRPDLGLTVQEIVNAGGLVERSLRRRRRDGVNFLAQDLIDREVEARRLHRKEVLRTRIPFPAGRSLYGREWLVERIMDGLANGPVLLTGVPGIGKTALAAEAAHRLLPEIDDLYWLHLLPHVEGAAQIRGKISADAQNAETYLVNHTVLLILEDLQPHHLPQINPSFLRHARTIATSVNLLPEWDGVIVNLPPLDETESARFFRAVRGSTDKSQEVVQISGGVPGMIEEYVRWAHLLPSTHLPDYLSLHQYLAQTWDSLSDTLKRLWVLAALAGDLEFDDILTLFDLAEQDVFDLVQKHILVVNQTHHLSPHARQFLLRKPHHVAELDHLIHASLKDMRRVQSEARSWVLMLCNGLQGYISQEALVLLMKKLSLVIPATGLWEFWKTAIQVNRPYLDPFWLDFEEARFLRWQGQFVQSMRLLRTVIQKLGEQGDFYGYAHALLELALAALYRNQISAALSAVKDAQQVFRRLDDHHGLQMATKLQARALLHTDPQATVDLLKSLPEQDASVLSAICEAALLIGRTEDAVAYAWQAAQLTESATPHHGRVLCLLAMALRADQQHSLAIDYQQQGVNVLNMTVDMIGLARARNNLGVLFYEEDNLVLAKANWRAALDLLSTLQDSVGLQTVRANLNTSSIQILPIS